MDSLPMCGVASSKTPLSAHSQEVVNVSTNKAIIDLIYLTYLTYLIE